MKDSKRNNTWGINLHLNKTGDEFIEFDSMVNLKPLSGNTMRESLKESWDKFSLIEQMGNIGSEIGRAARFKGKDSSSFAGAANRALELFDLTLRDRRWLGRLREIGRIREVFCDIVWGENQYQTTLSDLERYFIYFATAARLRAG